MVCHLHYERTGKVGRPRKVKIYSNFDLEWYRGDLTTDWHIHILLISKPSYAFRQVIKEYIDRNWSKLKQGKEVYKKNANIKITDYFIDQSEDILFCNYNFGEEENLKYSLKEYYREHLKVESAKRRLIRKHLLKPLSEDKYIKALDKIESKYLDIENYFYNISKSNKNSKSGNKVQSLKRKIIAEDSVF